MNNKMIQRNNKHYASCSISLIDDIPDEMALKESEEKYKKIEKINFITNISSFSKFIFPNNKYKIDNKFVLDKKNHCFVYKRTSDNAKPNKQTTNNLNDKICTSITLRHSLTSSRSTQDHNLV